MELDILLDLLSDGSDRSKKFILSYLEYGQNLPIFLNILTAKWNKIWELIESEQRLNIDDRKILFLRLLKNMSSDTFEILAGTPGLRKYIVETDDFLSLIANTDYSINLFDLFHHLRLRLKNLVFNEKKLELFQFFIRNGYYEISEKNIKTAFDYFVKDDDLRSRFYSRNFSMIIAMNVPDIRDYVLNHINTYVRQVFFKIESNKEEAEDNLIALLEHKNLEKELLEPVIQSQSGKVTSFRKVNKTELWTLLLINNKIVATIENLFLYFQEFAIDDSFVAFVADNDNITKLNENKWDPTTLAELNAQAFEKAILESAAIDDEVYSQIIHKLNYKFDDLEIGRLSIKKVKAIIESDSIALNDGFYKKISATRPSLTASYLVENATAYLALDPPFKIISKDFSEILSSRLSVDEKTTFINTLYDELEDLRPDLSNSISSFLLTFNVNLTEIDKSIVLKLIELTTNLEYKLSIITRYNGELSDEELLQIVTSLPAPYGALLQKTVKALHIDYSNTGFELSKILVRRFVDIISTISHEKNTIRINFRRN